MLKLFKTKHKKLLGIDISSASIKMLQISGSDEKYVIDAYGRVELPENAIEGNIIKDKDAIARSIRHLASTARISCKNAVIAVPDSSAISRVIQINEDLKEEDIEELVAIEADKHIPYPIDEINIDFEILGPSTKSSSMQDVLIVASRTEKVNDRVDIIHRAGLDVTIVDVESYAVERSVKLMSSELPEGGQNKVIAIIDFGTFYTNFYVLDNLKNIYVREEEFGGKQLIDDIMEHYDMTADEAREALEKGTLPDGYEADVLQSFNEQILLQVKRGLQFFFSTSRHAFVDQILLAGGIAKQPGIADLLQEHINIPTKIANPCEHMSFGKQVDKERILKDSPSLIVACGLALRAS